MRQWCPDRWWVFRDVTAVDGRPVECEGEFLELVCVEDLATRDGAVGEVVEEVGRCVRSSDF